MLDVQVRCVPVRVDLIAVLDTADDDICGVLGSRQQLLAAARRTGGDGFAGEEEGKKT